MHKFPFLRNNEVSLYTYKLSEIKIKKCTNIQKQHLTLFNLKYTYTTNEQQSTANKYADDTTQDSSDKGMY